MKKIVYVIYVLLAIVLTVQSGSALGISGASFADVEQGRTYNQTVILVNSPNDFDNHFMIEISGDIKNMISASPSEFDLAKGKVMQINLTLVIPENARLGEITGTITAVGGKTAPSSGGEGGANVGYAVATKGNIYANVVKQGALASVEISSVEVPSPVQPGSVAKITVTSRNNGNVPTTADFKGVIKKDGKSMSTIPVTSADFALGEEKQAKLFWDTQGMEEGEYECSIEATTIARGLEKTTTTVYKPIKIIVGNANTTISLIAIAGAAIVIIAVFGFLLKRRK